MSYSDMLVRTKPVTTQLASALGQRDRPASLIALSVLPLAQDGEECQLIQRSMLSDGLLAGDGVVPWHVWQCLRIAVIVPCHQG